MERSAIFVYTPICGTCKVAMKMIQVLRELRQDISIEEYNLNVHKSLAEKYHIENVPCLLIFEGNKLREKVYAFNSVPYLLEKL